MNDMRPPTDNLYKFLAIFGLILVGFSAYIPLHALEAYSRSGLLVDLAYGPIIDRLRTVDDYSRAKLECAISGRNQVSKASPCDKLPKIKAATDLANTELVLLRAKVEMLEVERNFLSRQYILYFIIGVVLGSIGFLLCVTGFWLWYVRLQRFLDAAVHSEASFARRRQRRTSANPSPRRVQ